MLQYSVYCYVRYTAEVSVSYEMPIQWEQFTLEIHCANSCYNGAYHVAQLTKKCHNLILV